MMPTTYCHAHTHTHRKIKHKTNGTKYKQPVNLSRECKELFILLLQLFYKF